MGAMVRNVLHWSEQGMSFENILKKLEKQVENTTAYILVDDLNHLVKGGRLSNGSAIWGISYLSNPFYILMLKAKSLFLKRYVQRRKLRNAWLP